MVRNWGYNLVRNRIRLDLGSGEKERERGREMGNLYLSGLLTTYICKRDDTPRML